MNNIPKKSRSMIEYLQSKILAGEYSENFKLPTIRELMKDFSLSNSSVKRGIDYLVSVELLETRPGAGIFVKRHNAKTNRKNQFKIAVFAASSVGVNQRQGVFPAVFAGIKTAAERVGVSLMLHHVDSSGFNDKQLKYLSQGADAVVFLLELGHYKKDINLSVPSVGVCMHRSSVKTMSFVDIDPFSAAEDAVAYFNRNKNKRMAIITADYPAFKNRANIFADCWRDETGEDAQIIISDRCSPIELKKEVSYYFCTGSLLQDQSQFYYEKTSKYLSDDFNVLGVDGKNLIDYNFHPTASIALHWENAGQAVFDECTRRLNDMGSAPRRIYLKGYLSEK